MGQAYERIGIDTKFEKAIQIVSGAEILKGRCRLTEIFPASNGARGRDLLLVRMVL